MFVFVMIRVFWKGEEGWLVDVIKSSVKVRHRAAAS